MFCRLTKGFTPKIRKLCLKLNKRSFNFSCIWIFLLSKFLTVKMLMLSKSLTVRILKLSQFLNLKIRRLSKFLTVKSLLFWGFNVKIFFFFFFLYWVRSPSLSNYLYFTQGKFITFKTHMLGKFATVLILMLNKFITVTISNCAG